MPSRNDAVEFPVVCMDCGGPLIAVDPGRVFDRPAGVRQPVLVHARHRDWSTRPHAALVVETLGGQVASLAAVRQHRRRRAA